MLTTTLAYATLAQRLPRTLETLENSSVVQREIDYFRENIGSVRNADDLINDRRLFRFAATAFDLESQVDSQAIFRKIMTEDFASPASLVNRLQNPKFTTFAAVFQFPGEGEKTVKDAEFIETIIDRYKRVRLEQREGEQYPGVRLALYFDRAAPLVDSYFGVIADRPLREFIFTAFNLPPAMNNLSVERLADEFAERFDIAELKSAEGRAALIRRFTAVYDSQNPAPLASSPLLSLVGPINRAGAPPITAIDPSALFALRTSS